LVSSPELIQDVLQKRAKLFQRPPLLRRVLKNLGGDNLMTREGDAWLSRRRLMQPSVQRAEVAALAEVVLDAIDAALDGWQASEEREVCMRALLVALTREVVARTLLGVSLLLFPELGTAFATITDFIAYRATTPLAPPLWFPSARNREVRAALRYLDTLTQQLLLERGASALSRPDLLSRLLTARDPDTDRGLDEAQLRHEIQMLIGAGETTTSEALSFCFSLLGSHPQVLSGLLDELQGALGQRRVAFRDLEKLPLLKQTLDETLRLYPPSYVLGRAPTEATRLAGIALRKGSTVLVSPYALHRDARFWDSPASFRPERFAPGGESERVPRYAYIPFGAGPRRCLAENLAQVEMMLAVASRAGPRATNLDWRFFQRAALLGSSRRILVMIGNSRRSVESLAE
jgi:cytochrome P450